MSAFVCNVSLLSPSPAEVISGLSVGAQLSVLGRLWIQRMFRLHVLMRRKVDECEDGEASRRVRMREGIAVWFQRANEDGRSVGAGSGEISGASKTANHEHIGL